MRLINLLPSEVLPDTPIQSTTAAPPAADPACKPSLPAAAAISPINPLLLPDLVENKSRNDFLLRFHARDSLTHDHPRQQSRQFWPRHVLQHIAQAELCTKGLADLPNRLGYKR